MEKPIRVLHVLGRLDRGGAETMVMNLYRKIDRSKIQFDFIIHTEETCDYSDEVKKLGGVIYSVPRYIGRNHFLYRREWENFFSKHPEYKIIHGHIRSTASIYLKIAKMFGLFTIAHSHSTGSRGNRIEQMVKNTLQIPIRYCSDFYFACSEEAGKWLFGKNVVNKENYRLIKNAIDINKYLPNATVRDNFRNKYKIEDRFVIGHVGSFTAPKNHSFLIEVFNEIYKMNNSALLLLVGDGELRPLIEEKISNYNLENNVIIIGSVPNVHDYLQMMDIFIFPSIFEGLGIALIEAQAAGLQSLVTDTLPGEVVVTDYVNKYSLSNNPKLWASKALEIGSSKNVNPNYIIEKLKSSGYDIQYQSSDIQNIYKGILSNFTSKEYLRKNE
ncbi:glycosyltransferase family 1 protein [Rossellomorea marisflavi]|uniref:glycosyltransferase family 1 protein n=1 Tax=Rossellomorea marisflavi TaxID=189381 RepID=UPI00203DCB69|nr:glycosyltransferase family 1 protein [Rossellomorea marisflavi]MCM2590890.1 glycosyltransferase family 1 protein [Rossellomorea marisflavi]